MAEASAFATLSFQTPSQGRNVGDRRQAALERQTGMNSHSFRLRWLAAFIGQGTTHADILLTEYLFE